MAAVGGEMEVREEEEGVVAGRGEGLQAVGDLCEGSGVVFGNAVQPLQQCAAAGCVANAAEGGEGVAGELDIPAAPLVEGVVAPVPSVFVQHRRRVGDPFGAPLCVRHG